ncbi:MAG TPA: alanine--tRNA ligase [Candidatus Nanoperiomorbaceae bacterium]|nr:alanine--tRNA ligase [Candidatus Nanoperiomorbaceae bacterium]
MNAQDIRNSYIKFFADRGHAIIPRAPLILKDDPTTLFTGSGMQPLLPYLLGRPHPKGVRLVDSQTCLRAQDIEDVGDNRHTTFFEMLGNWSMGDYFKEQQIRWFFEFLVDVVGLDPNKIYVSAFIGNKDYGIPRDDEAATIWQKVFTEKGIEANIVEIGSAENGDKRGIKPGERIFFYDDNENWWSRGFNIDKTPIGDPCGPDSEVFYDFGEQNHDPIFGEAHPASDSGRFMEIGNQVFMQYRRLEDGTFEPLEKKNVDFGGGLERIAAARIDSPDVFRISILWPIIEKLEILSGKKYESHTESMRVIADHLRAATFLAVDGCVPSNKEQGYVMRRLLRRAIRYSFDLGIEQNFLEEVVPVIAGLYVDDFPEVKEQRETIIAVLVKEEKAFRQTLRKGIQMLPRLAEAVDGSHGWITPTSAPGEILGVQNEDKHITGQALFTLYDTYGFPVELSIEEAFKQGVRVPNDWREQFDAKMAEQRQRSQTAAKGTFKGGLERHDDIHLKYHTATHLLQSALRELYGPELRQHGSNITADRLRFDFNHDGKMSAEDIARAEELVNGWITEDLPVSYKMYPTRVALDMGAIGPFGERYGDEVKVYQMGEGDHIASLEICGGPHVNHTGQLAEGGKRFKITKEESSSAGIRRIKAALISV